MKMKIHDITLKIHGGMAVYPGNAPPGLRVYRAIPDGTSNLSELALGVHTGTHVDAPSHIRTGGLGTESLSSESFVGKCRVLDLTNVQEGVTANDLEPFSIKKGEIILFKTQNSIIGFDKFREDFIYIEASGAELLARAGIKTLGVDYLSVQKFHSGNSIVHGLILDAGITLFEGLDLSRVKPGSYFFCGLPLRINSDGSPARAILIEGME
ncbi:cyclase family protein [Candidatus Micrarchaeota archaeon]|nr:cyclase family protein [Candidatus Micrarchaeota archaeon]